MESKTYTAQEMRDTVDSIMRVDVFDGLTCRKHCYQLEQEVKAMLRYAAEVVDENTQLKASKDRWMRYQETAAGERNACIDELRKKDAEIAELRECLRLSSNCMGMVVQWLGRYPAWQRCLTNGVARNRKFLEATKGAEDDK